MFTIRPPPPWSRMARAQATPSRTGPRTLMAIVASQVSAVKSRNGTGLYTPALFTRASIRPKCAVTAGTRPAQSSAAPTSARTRGPQPGASAGGADVAPQPQPLPVIAKPARGRLDLARVPGADGHRVAVGEQALGTRVADALAAPGDQRDFVHGSSLSAAGQPR